MLVKKKKKKVCPALQPCDRCVSAQLYFYSRLSGSNVCTGFASGAHAGDVGSEAGEARARDAWGHRPASADVPWAIFCFFSDKCNPAFRGGD